MKRKRMSKKETQQNIYHVNEQNLEIDYNKLAEAIVKANKKATEIPTPQIKENLLQMILHIICNKKQTQRAYTAYLMAAILSFALNAMSIGAISFSVVLFCYSIKNLLAHVMSFMETMLIFIWVVLMKCLVKKIETILLRPFRVSHVL